ncbi:hypothetical protein [Agromyces sp. ZXT2-3]|uniref:hypothetical protein n=1 Tax=Agromyces sp. ZXT2-3 TaxID=3461152 RepID=UPI004054F224
MPLIRSIRGVSVRPDTLAPGSTAPAAPLGREDVRGLRAAAAQAWADTMGDATSCALAKDGRSYPAGKYHEGRTAALGELLRALPSDASGRRVAAELSDASGQTVAALAASLADEWAAHPVPKGAGRDWESYRAGGAHALAELASRR